MHPLSFGRGARPVILGLASLGLAVTASACSAGEPPIETAEPTIQATPQSASPRQAAHFEEVDPFSEPPAGSVEILMTFGPSFDPEEATATSGDVTIFLRNDKGDGPPAAHNFMLGTSVDEPPLVTTTMLGSGQAGILTIEDLAPGTYTYWCTIIGPDGMPHSDMGMIGTLTVTP